MHAGHAGANPEQGWQAALLDLFGASATPACSVKPMTLRVVAHRIAIGLMFTCVEPT